MYDRHIGVGATPNLVHIHSQTPFCLLLVSSPAQPGLKEAKRRPFFVQIWRALAALATDAFGLTCSLRILLTFPSHGCLLVKNTVCLDSEHLIYPQELKSPDQERAEN